MRELTCRRRRPVSSGDLTIVIATQIKDHFYFSKRTGTSSKSAADITNLLPMADGHHCVGGTFGLIDRDYENK